jgi:excisionase family DNA binding protein
VTLPNLSDYITAKEASERAGLHYAHITLLATRGKIRAFKFGHAWLIDKASLEAYLASDRRPGPKPPPSPKSKKKK